MREMALQDVKAQKAYYESSLGQELKAIIFFYGGIRQMSRAMPRAAMAQEMEMDANGRRASTSLSLAAPAVAPTFDEVEYQTKINVVFEIVNEN